MAIRLPNMSNLLWLRRTTHWIVAASLNLAFICLAPSLGLAQTAVRTWHAASGGFSVDAELIDVREDKVQLKKKDGSAIWVELNKLSLADIRFVEESMNKAAKTFEKSSATTSHPTTCSGERQAEWT